MKYYLSTILGFCVLFVTGSQVESVITNPLLFELTKDGVRSHVIGTHHSTPFEEFSPLTQKFLKSAKLYVTENSDRILTKGFLNRIGALRKKAPDWLSDKNLTNALSERIKISRKEEDQDWFSSLSKTAQNQLTKKITPFFEKRRLDLPISDLQPWMAFACYQNAEHLKGMDSFLVDHYKNRVTGLESFEDLLPFIKGTIDLSLFDKELCADASGQLPPKPEEEEFVGSFQNGIIDDEVDDEIILRNQGWVSKITSLHAFGTLFGVGTCHLKDLLNRLESGGFKIRRINLDKRSMAT